MGWRRANSMNSVAWALLLFVLTSCRQPCFYGSCMTRCGSYACDTTRCEELQAAENRAVAVFDDAGFNTCKTLNGYEIDVRRMPDGGPDVHWIDSYSRDIAGDTRCEVQTIRLGTDSWQVSAYSHEVRHALDSCQTPDHEGWLDAGVFLMIEEAQ